ncbi:hypothetical protein HYV88_00365 [Candidatus Woesearchaeota archaeon]|nr:hypothetical protein [Candidatus Woesearchaeota archaeon]
MTIANDIIKTGLSILAILFMFITVVTDNLTWLILAGVFIVGNIILLFRDFLHKN